MRLDDDILAVIAQAEAEMTEAQAILGRALGKVNEAIEMIHTRKLPNIQIMNLEGKVKHSREAIRQGRVYCRQLQRGEG